MGGQDKPRRLARCLVAILAAILLAALAFFWGRRTGYETARPWELTNYGDYAPRPAPIHHRGNKRADQ